MKKRMTPEERSQLTATLAPCPVCKHTARLGRDDAENLSDNWVLCSSCTLRSRINDWPKRAVNTGSEGEPMLSYEEGRCYG